jgi:dephospho-CoA kinase
MNYLVGLTGGIGSGKTTVANLLAERGARLIDTDIISRELTQPNGAAIAEIRAAFGSDFISENGALDRNAMRTLVFTDTAAKAKLEAILHPLIQAETIRLASSPTNAPYTLVVIPLLFESGCYADWMDHTITVDCSSARQIARTSARSALDAATIHAIMSQQYDSTRRNALADTIIDNEGSADALLPQITQTHEHLCQLAAQNH